MAYDKLSFGEYLKQLIRDVGMTHADFYTALGIKKPYFYDIISGRSNPPPYPMQLKAMEILKADDEVREKFFDLAAKGRNELPADIAQYVNDNPNVLSDIRRTMKRITSK